MEKKFIFLFVTVTEKGLLDDPLGKGASVDVEYEDGMYGKKINSLLSLN